MSKELINKFTEKFSKFAQSNGIGKISYHIEEIKKNSLNIYKHKLDKSTSSSETLIYIEGEVSGKLGTAFTEDLSENLFQFHVNNIIQTAEYNNTPYLEKTYTNLSQLQEPKFTTDIPSLTEKLLEAEKVAYDYDSRITNIVHCGYSSNFKRITLANESGNTMEDILTNQFTSFRIIAEENGRMQTAGAYKVCELNEEIDFNQIALKVAKDVIAMFSAEPLKTGNYPVIISNTILCEMLSTYLPLFYSARVQNKMSLLAGKAGTKIASTLVSLTEDPLNGLVSRRFDDEGTITKKKAIIDGGILTAFLNNKKVAGVDELTGNGFKNNYKENVQTGVTNLIFGNETSSIDEMIKSIDNGFLWTNCDGMFAGANIISGDFSLLSKGFLIQNGKISRPVNQVTVGGNFFDMLNNIKEIGNDYHTSSHAFQDFVKAPSILIPNLSISGL